MWAHAEYVKLLRSVIDGQVFDVIPEVADRYLGARPACRLLEIWKPNRQVGREARICAADSSAVRVSPPLGSRRVADGL